MRVPAMNCPRSRMVSAKWPRWFVPNCVSNPSWVRPNGVNITPALFISTSMTGATSAICAAAARTLASEARSTTTVDSRAPG